jgi:tRNA-dihydrouridine synthase B
VVANGDIDSPEKAKAVFQATGADAVMIGRAAQGNPWIFREIQHFLTTGQHLAPPSLAEMRAVMQHHLSDHVALYGEFTGTRSARKHIAWYTQGLPGASAFRQHLNTLDEADAQWQAIADYFDELETGRAPQTLAA